MGTASARLAALYRYPIKGFSPERRSVVTLEAGRGVPCDRLFAVENGPSGFDPEAPAFTPKSRFVVLASLPRTARARTLYDEATGCVSLDLPGAPTRRFDLSGPAGRHAFAAALESFYAKDERRGPFRTLTHEIHRFTDHPQGDLSLINLASVQELGEASGTVLDPLRFRGNLHLEGWPAFAEGALLEGAALRVGGARLKVFKPIVRCAAVEVDPTTGIRDLDLVSRLFDHTGGRTLGLYLSVAGGGRIREGDEVEIL
jgi:uncharacterized protein YcbX